MYYVLISTAPGTQILLVGSTTLQNHQEEVTSSLLETHITKMQRAYREAPKAIYKNVCNRKQWNQPKWPSTIAWVNYDKFIKWKTIQESKQMQLQDNNMDKNIKSSVRNKKRESVILFI